MMIRSRRLLAPALVATALALSATGAKAQDLSREQEEAVTALQGDIVECAVYFNISEDGVRRRGDAASVEMADNLAATTRELFTLSYNLGTALGMTYDGMMARIGAKTEQLKGEMSNNFDNYTRLVERYHEGCVTLVRDWETRLNEIVAQ